MSLRDRVAGYLKTTEFVKPNQAAMLARITTRAQMAITTTLNHLTLTNSAKAQRHPATTSLAQARLRNQTQMNLKKPMNLPNPWHQIQKLLQQTATLKRNQMTSHQRR